MRSHSKTRSLTPNKPKARSASRNNSRIESSSTKDSNSKCPLSDPELGIISENDHRVGLCLCQFCTCSEHICPSFKLQDAYPQSFYQTKYKLDYKPHELNPPLRQEQKRYIPNNQPMDLRTTHQTVYQPYTLQIKRSQSARSITPTLKLCNTTTYKKEFPNWGPHDVDHYKRFQPPLRSTELPFQEHSTYKNSFKSIDSDKIELYKTDIRNLSAYGSRISLGPKDVKYNETTNRREFKDYSSTNLTTRVKPKTIPTEPLNVANVHFTTSNQTTYRDSRSNFKDPRLTRMKLSGMLTSR